MSEEIKPEPSSETKELDKKLEDDTKSSFAGQSGSNTQFHESPVAVSPLPQSGTICLFYCQYRYLQKN